MREGTQRDRHLSRTFEKYDIDYALALHIFNLFLISFPPDAETLWFPVFKILPDEFLIQGPLHGWLRGCVNSRVGSVGLGVRALR